MKKQYYIQSLPPSGVFIHHAPYTALKRIVQSSVLREGKPYKCICLTTDPGRYTTALPQLLGASMVDGYVEFPAQELLDGNYVFPILYRCNEDEATHAKSKGWKTFSQDDVPTEYRYILPYATRNILFVNENEWAHLGPQLWLPEGFRVYVRKRYLNRFRRAVVGRIHEERILTLER